MPINNVCQCMRITYTVTGGVSTTIQVNEVGTFNGYFYWEFSDGGVTYTIWHDTFDNWYITTDGVGGGVNTGCNIKSNLDPCPFASIPVWTPNSTFTEFTTESCEGLPCCIQIHTGLKGDPNIIFEIATPTGIYNGTNYWKFNVPPSSFDFYLIRNIDGEGRCSWRVYQDASNTGFFPSGVLIYTTNPSTDECIDCPRGVFTLLEEKAILSKFEIYECGACIPIEDRIFKKYNAIKFPEIFEEQNRGWFKCCEPQIVLAGNGTESWKNDVNSAWIKLSDPTDSVTFSLLKDGQPTIYIPTPVAFVNEPDAYYTTVQWLDVLNSDGEGCYSLMVDYNISGVVGSFTWGVYKLKTYSIENALETARIRVFLNLNQQIEGINFTDSNVEDSIRFYGFIGERQPNMEIDNLVYGNREMKTVVRENLNTYQITTDPSTDEVTKKLTDLYLLSENELFISDYNAHNHSYRYLDIPAIVQESPEIEYLDILQRKAILKCLVGDKFKNKRTFY